MAVHVNLSTFDLSLQYLFMSLSNCLAKLNKVGLHEEYLGLTRTKMKAGIDETLKFP